MKTYNLIVYLNIILLYQVIDAVDYADTLNDVSEPSETNYQCPINATYCEDLHLNLTQLVNKYGYSLEEHEVETSDGYQLILFRIANNGPPVLLVHGNTLSSADFLTTGPEIGLAYVLADAGFDVWLANFRGTRYSLRHVTLPTDSAAFWDFSWDDIGRYDMPAFIDRILDTTNAKDVKMIGHSQGTNIMLSLCSERPEYNEKVGAIVLLAVTSFKRYANATLFRLASTVPDIYLQAKSIGLYSLFSEHDIGPIVNLLAKNLCATPETAYKYCLPMMFLAFGGDYGQVDKNKLPVIFKYYPSAISIKGQQHYIQITESGNFTRYDYGEEINLKKYGSIDPPEYPLYKVKTKVVVCWSENDSSSSEKDIQILVDKLPNVIDVYKVPYQNFTHMDFIFAKDVKTLLYDKVVEILKST